MLFKIDTKKKFHVITIQEAHLAANMTAELENCLVSNLEKDVKNVVLNLEAVASIDVAIGELLVQTQQRFYENSHSFVICNLQDAVEAALDKENLLELMNVTPTESEAWDIVQMEEIEREFFGDDSEGLES